MDDDQKELMRAYQKVFLGSQEGQLVLWDILNFSEVFRDFAETNAGVYRHNGKRSVGLMILQMTEFTPKQSNMSKIHETVENVSKRKGETE